MDDHGDGCFAVIVGVGLIVTAFMIGTFVGENYERSSMQKSAIQHKAARFHPRTGQFEWTTEETQKQE